jgi:hypothetical protein
MGDYEPGNCKFMDKAEQIAEQKKKRQFMKGVLNQFVRRSRTRGNNASSL